MHATEDCECLGDSCSTCYGYHCAFLKCEPPTTSEEEDD